MDIIRRLLGAIMESLAEEFPKERIVAAVDRGLDKVENMVEASDNKIDDMIILPLIKKAIREPFGIADNDEASE